MTIKTIWQYFKYLVRGAPAQDARAFAFIKPGMLVFDIGANRGNYSQLFLSKGAKVIAVEPQKECAEFLRLRFAFTRKIKVIESGAGSSPGKHNFYVSTADTVSSMNKEWIDKVKQTHRFPEEKVTWNNSILVEITTLNKLITEHGVPDYVKIDVEGFELEVLKGLTHPVPNISFEYTLPEMESDAIACIEYIDSIGSYRFISQIQSPETFINREEIVKEIRGMSESGTLHNGDIFAKITQPS